MMNYLKSEIYRTLRNRSLVLASAISILLTLAGVILLSYMNQSDVNFRYGNTRFALGNIYYQMMLMLIATVVIVGFIHDGEERQHTIKHSVAFGIKRSTIYLGRFVNQYMTSLLLYVVSISAFTALSFALLTHSNEGELELLIQISIASITCLGAGLAVTHYFLMVTENEVMANLKAMSVLVIFPSIFNMMGRRLGFFKYIADLCPYNAVEFSSLINGEADVAMTMIRSLLIGLGWMIFFIIMGLVKFQKKEVL